MSRIHFEKRRDFLKGAACMVAAGSTSTFVPKLSLMGTALAQATLPGYKALVCVYLDGGNDSWNLLIPADNSETINVPGRTPLPNFLPTRYGWYATSRGGVFQGSPAALALLRPGATDPGAPFLPPALALNGGQYGLNPACNDLQTLFNSGNVAFVANVGTLVEPVRRSAFNSFRRPPQLYSHNDQTSLWQIGGGSSSSANTGWGGRLAGRLLQTPAVGPASLPPCISIAGQTRFLVGEYSATGQPVTPYSLSTQSPAARTLANYIGNGDPTAAADKRFEVLTSLLAATYPPSDPQQAMAKEYGDIVGRSINAADTVNRSVNSITTIAALANFVIQLGLIPNSGLGNQLRQVARMIAVSHPAFASIAPGGTTPINANRQIFFVRTGGYDTHDGQIPTSRAAANGIWAGHQGLLQQVSQAVNRFIIAINALNQVNGYSGVSNSVVGFTMSDFSRTINSNGNGTDHAWGSVQLAFSPGTGVGAPLAGGQVYGRYPLQLLNRQYSGPADALGECFGRGEFLPTTAVDQYAATFARWMDLPNADLAAVFPNIDNYGAPRFGADGVMAYSGRVIPNMLTGIT